MACVVAAVSLFAALGSFRLVGDPDLHWHLRTGEWIIANRSVPRVELLSHTFAGQPWRWVDWISDVIFAAVHGASGIAGIEAIVAVMAALAFALAGARMSRGPRPASLLLMAVMLLLLYGSSAFRFTPRPQTIMMVFLGIELLLIERVPEESSRPPWLVIPLLALWSNMHASSFVGLGVLGAYGVGRALALRRLSWAEARRPILSLVLLGALGFLAVLATPNPVGRVAALADLFQTSVYSRYITEYLPTPPAVLLGPLGALGLLVIVGLLANRAAVRAWELLVVLLTAWMAARYVRFIPVFTFVAAPIGYRHLAAGRLRLMTRGAAWRRGLALADPAAALLLGAAFLVAFGFDRPLAWLGDAQRPRIGLARGVFPEDAARFIARVRPRGPMFNWFHFGGYLMHALPDVPVFIDGRTLTVYDDRFFYENATIEKRDWRPLFQRHGVEYAVLSPGVTSADVARDPGWTLVYFDDVAEVCVRNAGPNADLARTLGYTELHPSLTLSAGSVPDQPAPEKLSTLRREADRAVDAAPRSAVARMVRGRVRAVAGDAAGFEEDMKGAVSLDPSLPDPWVRLGRLHLATRQILRARDELERAVALIPDEREVRELLVLACMASGDMERAHVAAAPLVRPGGDVGQVLEALSASPLGAWLRDPRGNPPPPSGRPQP